MNIPAEILVNGKWRPTRNSNGKLIHSTPEGLLAFWKWFGESKVVDDKGRPLVVYHGTTGDHVAFDPSERGKFTNEDPGAELAWFFADNKGDASTYAARAVSRSGDWGAKERIVAAYLKAENILDNTEESLGDNFESMAESDVKFIKHAEYEGFDGASWTDGNMMNTPGTIAVFESTQIKSATGNRGTFDGADPVMTNPRRRRRK